MNDLFLLAWTNPIESTAILFVEFAVLMKLIEKAKDTKYESIVKYTLVPPFAAQDWLVNLAVMSTLFLELPSKKTELVTHRFQRYKLIYSGRDQSLNLLEKWRYIVAKGACKLLNKYDPGHC